MFGNEKDENYCLIFIVAMIGVPVFLIMENPVFFWLVFVPLSAWIIFLIFNRSVLPIAQNMKNQNPENEQQIEDQEISVCANSKENESSNNQNSDCNDLTPQYEYVYEPWHYG